MAGFQIETPPAHEPVTLAQAKSWMRISITDDDDFITGVLIPAAREAVESFTNRSLCTKGYLQTFDAFPYYTDSVVNQNAYPPSYYSLPMYSTTLWNYSQMIKLYASSPNTAVTKIDYTKPDGTVGTLLQDTDFILDTVNEPNRIFPRPGAYWPAVQYIPNAVRIHYASGYSADGSAVPGRAKTALLMAVAGWYENREAAAAQAFKVLPYGIDSLLWSIRIYDVSPTRS